jgi:hypothetical protein
MVVFFRSWMWDPLMFHTTITNLIVQEGSLGFMDYGSGFPQVKGYPRLVHLLAAWNVMFQGNTELDDASQLWFAAIGMLTCAAWARRMGTTIPFALSAGAAWILFPPVFLQVPSSHADVAVGALFAAGMYFLAFGHERRDRWFACIAFGLYIGAKHTGLFHLLLATPLFALRAWQWWKERSAPRVFRVLDVAGSFLMVPLLGAHKYIQNAFSTGNPFAPFVTKIPLLGITLPGEQDPSTQYGGPPGGRPYFFGIPGEGKRFLEQLFYWDKQAYWPDVRDGFFGVPFTLVAVPSLLIALALIWKPAIRHRLWPLAFLLAATLSVPSAYWPRYSMAASIVAVLAPSLLVSVAPWTWVRRVISLVMVVAFGVTLYWCQQGLTQTNHYQWPALFFEARRWSAFERATKQITNWNWPEDALRFKEEHFEKGDVVAWGDGFGFPGELFTRDLRTRTLFIPASVNPSTWLTRLAEAKVRWVLVPNGPQAQFLESTGARFVRAMGNEGLVLYEFSRPP